MTNREIELLYPTLKDLYNYGLDAIIVQDLGYAEYLHRTYLTYRNSRKYTDDSCQLL